MTRAHLCFPEHSRWRMDTACSPLVFAPLSDTKRYRRCRAALGGVSACSTQQIHEVLCFRMQLFKITCVKVIIKKYAANFTMLSSCSCYHLCFTRKPVYVPVYLLAHRVCVQCLSKPEEGIRSPLHLQRQVAVSCWEPNLGPLQQQIIVLIVVPSHQVLAKNFKNKINTLLCCTVVFSYFSLFKRFS